MLAIANQITHRHEGGMVLNDVKAGKKTVMKSITVGGVVGRRLSEMGFVPGTELIVVNRAPLGSPIEVRVRGYEVIIGSREAKHIQVEGIK